MSVDPVPFALPAATGPKQETARGKEIVVCDE
jgi:hypothetical protein